MYTLDANIFVRTLHPSQPYYTTCQTLINRFEATVTPIIVPQTLLAEVAASVRRESGDPMRARIIPDGLRSIPNIQFIAIDAELGWDAAEVAADYALRGMDSIYVAVARRYGCTFVTLDEEARTRAARVVTALTPQQALAALG